MTITLQGLFGLVVIAGICGAVGRALVGGSPGGFITSMRDNREQGGRI